MDKEKIVLGYFGGSITEGAGASSDEKTYRSLVTKWFERTFPHTKFEEINAGVGGTGSDLGVFRLENDLLCKGPDIVFIEFAVNDYKKDHDLCKNSIEGIVRKILKYNSKTLIIFLYTVSKQMICECCEEDQVPPSVLYHCEIADYYHIPSINMGKELYNYIKNQHIDITEFLPDQVHPNDSGYKFYADVIIDLLPDMEWKIKHKHVPYSSKNYENAALIMSEILADHVWRESEGRMMNRLDHYIYSDHIGAELTFPFEGNMIGLYWAKEKDSGNIVYSIDNQEYKEISSWDKFALEFGRASYVILDSDLKKGKHTLHLKISNKKDNLSEGNYIRIGAFLVNVE